MAKMREVESPVAKAIQQYYVSRQDPRDHPVLRCSKIGDECERSIWYEFHWVTSLKRHDGRLERLFQTGHREEERMIHDLRMIGCKVEAINPETRRQWQVSFLNGVFKGSCDGIVSLVPGAEKTDHLLECKTHNNKSFQDWRHRGVELAKPVHYAQMQIYMMGLGLERALYMAHNKDNDEVETERIKFNPAAADAILAKAERIAFAPVPPPKQESYACRWCKHKGTCLESLWPRVNCRTCLHSTLMREGVWKCERHDVELDLDEQAMGCVDHLYLPALVPGEQTDADENAGTVTYQLYDLNIYVDGRDRKIIVPEVEG